ncbi:hypothetical protein [Aliivibrio finisterrensis]|uniref:hypothetical protein n=1 Tax=Aliivibrio finisterrensis TaxID=511998 RepID=UPI00142EB54C|nr:hypothetical protein [Aliivibrio finisterrensis]
MGKITKKVLISATILISASTEVVGLAMLFGSMAMTVPLSGQEIIENIFKYKMT